MDDRPQKTADRLARIRENQRRSRAKKQEYIQELEQKLAASREEARQKDVQHRLAVQKLEAENRKLRSLLSVSGLQNRAVEEILRTDVPLVERKVAIPPLRRPEPRATVAEAAGSPSVQRSTAEVPEGTPDLLEGSQEPQQSQKCQSVCDCAPPEEDRQWPGDEDVLNTTLCAIADELISQFNTRGVDMEEIRRKLWDGFRKGLTTGEGCRVQNQILFQVLDEISND